MLQLDDVPLRIGRIDERNRPCTWNIHRDKLADDSPARRDHRISGCLNIVYCEGDVRESGPVDRSFLRFVLVVVLEYLQRRTPLAIAGKAQVYALNPCSRGTNPSYPWVVCVTPFLPQIRKRKDYSQSSYGRRFVGAASSRDGRAVPSSDRTMSMRKPTRVMKGRGIAF